MKRTRSIRSVVAVSVVFAVALMPTLMIAVWEVLHGRGAAVYTNVYGLAIQYTSVLIFLTTLVAALVVAYIARLIFFWRDGHDGAAKLIFVRLRPYDQSPETRLRDLES